MIIDAVELFANIQKEVMFDHHLIEEFGLTVAEIDSYIIISDKMFAFIPEIEE